MPSNQFDEISILYNLRKLESESSEQYLERLSIAKTNSSNLEDDHDLISLGNLDNNLKLNLLEVVNLDQTHQIRFINHSLEIKERANDNITYYDSESDDIYLIKDLIALLNTKGFHCLLKEENHEELKTSFLFNMTDDFISDSITIQNKTFIFPEEINVYQFYLSESLREVQDELDLKVYEYSYIYDRAQRRITLSPLLTGNITITFSGYKKLLNWHWSLNKLYDIYHSSFDNITLTNDKLLTPKGVHLYNLINKTYSNMWG